MRHHIVAALYLLGSLCFAAGTIVNWWPGEDA